MHFMVDQVIYTICMVFVVCFIGHFLFHILYIYDEFKEYKRCGLKLDWTWFVQVIFILATILSIVYLFWISPITITISH